MRIEIDGSTMSLLATDRFRLSHRELTLEPADPRRVRGRPWSPPRCSATRPSH
nr:hypothetical protein [Nocardioides sp. B-3]